jgi:hypothetical protein
VAEKLAWAERRRDSDLPTVPSTLADELLFNPFMRHGDRKLWEACEAAGGKEAGGYTAGAGGAAAVLAAVRSFKDSGRHLLKLSRAVTPASNLAHRST